jgi:phenylacetic acid degradation protein
MRAPARSLIAGNPARIVRELPAASIVWTNDGEGEYQRLARESLTDFAECEPLAEAEPDRRRVSGDARAVRLRLGGT